MDLEIEEKYKLIMENFGCALNNLDKMNSDLRKVNDTYENMAKNLSKDNKK